MNIVLFFTRGYSLEKWESDGMLEREMALYCRLSELGHRVSMISYGSKKEREIAEKFPDIRIYYNRFGLKEQTYCDWLWLLHRNVFLNADIFKTNQMYGSDTVVRIARKFKKPLIARFGYMWSEFVKTWKGEDSDSFREAVRLEEFVLPAADRVVVTTLEMKQNLIKRNVVDEKQVEVIPNYVDTEHFCGGDLSPQRDILFIGRIQEQKNVRNLLLAIRRGPWSAKLIGQGALKAELMEEFSDLESRVEWVDKVPNSKLPDEIRASRVFVLPSLFEGHPKVLIEAMAAEAAVIGADTDGIRELLLDGETGWLCQTDPESIFSVIQAALAAPEERLRRAGNAREYVLNRFSLDIIVQREVSLYQETIERGRRYA